MNTVEPGGDLPVGAPGPVVLRMMLGNQLHQLREAAGVTAEQAGYEIRASRSKISRMESGRVSFKERDAAASSSFSVLRFAEPELPDVAYIELLTTALYLEKREDVDHYMEVINHLSIQALTPDRTTRFLNEMTRET